MRVAGVKTFIVDSGVWKNWLFVKVQTDEGLYGWGEAFTEAGRERAIAAEIEALGSYLIGKDPSSIRGHTGLLQVDAASRRRSLEFCSALSALEIALWDITGKALGQPVYKLLGGPYRDRIRVYANSSNGRARTPEAWAELAVEMVRKGFTAVKVYPWPMPMRPVWTQQDEDQAVKTVQAVREAVGLEVEVMVDLYRHLTPARAVRLARRLEPFRPLWIEEPVPSDNLEALAEVRAQSPIPILTGESLFTKTEFRDLFARRAADFISPDVCNCGGILEMTEIGAWAEPHLTMVAPHDWNSQAIGLAATLQASACIQNFLMVEYLPVWTERSNEVLHEPIQVKDGYITLPALPGLGVDLDEKALARFPATDYLKKRFAD